jgi:hypothetical protein
MKRVFEATVAAEGVELTEDRLWLWINGGTEITVEDNGDETYTDHVAWFTDRDGADHEREHTFTADQIILGRELHA